MRRTGCIFEEKQKTIERICLVGIISATLLFAILVFYYTDIMDVLNNAVLLYETLRGKGEFRHYYTYSAEYASSVYAANYEILIYFVFMIWNLPTAIAAERGFDYMNSLKAIVWCKCLVLLTMVACVYLLWKIYDILAEETNRNKKEEILNVALFFLSSPLVIMAGFIACQFDSLAFVFILLGVYYYLQDKTVPFLLSFYISFPFKAFSIFVFIPLILLHEKKIWKAALELIGIFTLPCFFNIIFRMDPSYDILLSSQNRDARGLITGAVISIGKVDLNIFIALYFVICLFSLFAQYEKRYAIYLCAVTFASFVLFVPIRSYWVFLMEPFIILIILNNIQLRSLGFLLNTIGEIAGMVFFLYNHWIYNTGKNTSYLFLKKIFAEPEERLFGSFEEIVKFYELNPYISLFRTIFITSFIVLLIIYLPSFQLGGKNYKSPFGEDMLLYLRILFTDFMITLMVIAEFYPGGKIVINTMTADGDMPYFEADLASGSSIEQSFIIHERTDISQILLQFYNPSTGRGNRGRIKISIRREEDGAVIYSTLKGNSSIPSESIYRVKMKKASLDPGSYVVSVSGLITRESGSLFLCLSEEEMNTIEPAIVNGVRQDHPMYIQIK